MPDTFPRLLIDHARSRGDRPSIREKDLGIWQTFTWGQALAEVRALACGLHALGLRRGDTLAIVGDNRPRLYWAMDAAQALGAIPVPLYQDSVAEEVAFADPGYILENGRVVMDGEAATLASNADVKEFYLGLGTAGRKSFRDAKHYRRRKRWLA